MKKYGKFLPEMCYIGGKGGWREQETVNGERTAQLEDDPGVQPCL
jgi:hypothetical protein